jgi:STAS domain
VCFCDASGLAVLIGTSRWARLLSGFLRLAGVSPEVSRVLRSTGLDRHLLVFPTVGLAAGPSSTPSTGAGGATQTARRNAVTAVLRVLGPDIRSVTG